MIKRRSVARHNFTFFGDDRVPASWVAMHTLELCLSIQAKDCGLSGRRTTHAALFPFSTAFMRVTVCTARDRNYETLALARPHETHISSPKPGTISFLLQDVFRPSQAIVSAKK